MNEIRVGKVQSVSAEDKTAIIYFEDRKRVSPPLKVLQRAMSATADETSLTYDGVSKKHTHKVRVEEWLPNVGDVCVCVIVAENGGGYILGKI